jgi:acyl transferase domain-containing protein
MAELVDTMGGYQAPSEHGVVGEQIVYPTVADDSWRPHPEREAALRSALERIPDLHWSIHLGGQAVLGGSAEAIARAMAELPTVTFSGATFPRKLPLHSAFHTPLMAATAERAARELAHLRWQAPRVPLVDGQAHIWRPRHADPAALRDWTLGPQVTEAYDFSRMIRTALGEYAPDLLLLPGPGSNLGGAIAQVLISAGWQGLRSRSDFLARQATERPILWSMRRRAGA